MQSRSSRTPCLLAFSFNLLAYHLVGKVNCYRSYVIVNESKLVASLVLARERNAGSDWQKETDLVLIFYRINQ